MTNSINHSPKFLKKLSLFKDKFILVLFYFYKAALQPYLGNSCKFHPSCSCYAKESFQKHNFIKATLLTTWRLLRCQPFSQGGLDPVPQSAERLNG